MEKIKVALIQPTVEAGTSLGIRKSPESIQALAGQLDREGYEVRMFHDDVDSLVREVTEFAPDYVGVSSMTNNFPKANAAAVGLKQIFPNTPIVLGGWHASGCAISYLRRDESETLEEILNPNSPFDFVVVGEGEIVLSELIRRLSRQQSLDGLKGVGYLKDEKIEASTAERIKDLDSLADPSWNGLPIDNYRDMRTGDMDLSVHFNRGCRFQCSFCSTPEIYKKGVRRVSADKAVDHIISVLDRFHPTVITFTDEDFFSNLNWVEDVVNLMSKYGLHKRYHVKFDTFASVNDLNRIENEKPELLKRMAEAGFSSFTIGVESFNPTVLREYNKELMVRAAMAKEQRDVYDKSPAEKDRILVESHLNSAQRAIDFALKHGIYCCGDYMVGYFGETEEEVRKGFKKFSDLNNMFLAYIPIFIPFPGTRLWKAAYESGKIKRTKEGNIDWSLFDPSEGAMKLGYGVTELRKQLEVQFYTSDRYLKDMEIEIERNPSAIEDIFKPRFDYLNKKFPGNEIVERVIKEIGG